MSFPFTILLGIDKPKACESNVLHINFERFFFCFNQILICLGFIHYREYFIKITPWNRYF